jgi:molybdopterin-guanine dinucleotide biosynthesis protein A
MSRIAALVLAGGMATRMGGGDKPLLAVGNASMLARVITALAAETSTIAISANGDPSRFAAFGLPVLPDGKFAGEGPLAGVLAGLDWADANGAEALLTVPGDTPFIPPGLAAALSPAPSCAASRGQPHHLVALWPVAARDTLRKLLSAPGPRSVARFADSIAARRVAFAAADRDPFFNVNTPEDLAIARGTAENAGMEGKS